MLLIGRSLLELWFMLGKSEHLCRILNPVLGNPTDSLIAHAWLASPNVLRPSKILRITYKFIWLGLQREQTIKVEVNLNNLFQGLLSANLRLKAHEERKLQALNP